MSLSAFADLLRNSPPPRKFHTVIIGAQKNWPLVSILILTYRHQDYVSASLHSALNVDYPNLEVHVLDDGSDDATLMRARAAAIGAGHPVEIETQAQSGGRTGANTNALLRRARGKYVLFLSGDDALEVHYGLRHMIALMEAEPNLAFTLPRALHVQMGDSSALSSIYTPTFRDVLRSGDPERLWREHLCRQVSRVFLQGLVMPLAICSAVGGFDEATLSDDYAFVMRLVSWMRNQKRRFAFFEDCLWLYRVHEGNIHASGVRQRRLVFEVVSRHVPVECWTTFLFDHKEPIDFAEFRQMCDDLAEYFGTEAQRTLIPDAIRRYAWRALDRRDLAALRSLWAWPSARRIAAPFILPRAYRLLMPRWW